MQPSPLSSAKTMANKELIFNTLAEGIALGTTELCDILRYDNCDLDAKAKQSLIDKLACEKTEDARIPAQERRKVLMQSLTLASTTASPAIFAFSNTGKNLISFSVACVELADTLAGSPEIALGNGVYPTYVFTEAGETISVEAPEGGYLSGDLEAMVPITAADNDNILKVVFTYEEI